MPMDEVRVRQCLKSFDLGGLFVEELGWDRHTANLSLAIDTYPVDLTAIAQKRGMVAYICAPLPDGTIPEYRLRRRIEQQVTKTAREHLIIYVDRGRTSQVWQWVRREQGKPAACREHTLTAHQSGEALIQKLGHVTFDLAEEEELTLTAVTGRARSGFDVERVTRAFYDRFKNEHTLFLKSIEGIEPAGDQEWYASVLLNRLMFVYFIQKKRFLDGNPDYLRSRLRMVQSKRGTGHFHSFYRAFLLRLFHEGLGQQLDQRSADLGQLIGRVPYLNGGIFQRHQIEDSYDDIQIPDEAFERIFDFFDGYQWHLDERPLRNDDEINPDVLGFIFEKYINQKEMGAYYTREDITEYISRSTVVPYLLDATREECRIAFAEDGPLWSLLVQDPARYLFPAMKKGSSLDLPHEIAAGIGNVAARGDWNKPAAEEYALPTETWREVVARRQRADEVRATLTAGQLHDVNDLITYNLDIRQFAQDAIESSEGPDLLRAFWKAIEGVRILDPTVGSGAFLFAALNVLEPLYIACLDRMAALVSDAERSDRQFDVRQFGDFRAVLERVRSHPNERYFILKSIIVNNLYGVDIMEEATEICKLRLFLKMVSQVARVEDIEPLPDIDFNIRAGNMLVGYARLDDIERMWTEAGRLELERDREKLDMLATEYGHLLKSFREQQLGQSAECQISKQDVSRALNDVLRPELDTDLWRLYRAAGLFPDPPKSRFTDFAATHHPLHWFIEFPEVMAHGGFDVVISNPPYVEYRKVNKEYRIAGYATESCGNLYAFCAERAIELLQGHGRMGFIIPVAAVCTDGFAPLQRILQCTGRSAISNFNDRPSKLFDGLEHIRLCIVLHEKVGSSHQRLLTTRYNKWAAIERPYLFQKLSYVEITRNPTGGCIPKLSTPLEGHILSSVLAQSKCIEDYAQQGGSHLVYYTRKLSGFVQVLSFVPTIVDERGVRREPSELKAIPFVHAETRDIWLSLLNSSLFFWWLTIHSDCRNLNRREVCSIALDLGRASAATKSNLVELARRLMADLVQHSEMQPMNYEKWGKMHIQCIFPKRSKSIIDEIDRVLARHYGFTDEELDFIINYDVKYRLGPYDEPAPGHAAM